MNRRLLRLLFLLLTLALAACGETPVGKVEDRSLHAGKAYANAVAAPQILNPAEELAQYDPRGLLRWTEAPGADVYEVWAFADAGLAQLVETSGALRSREYPFRQLAGGSRYYVKLYYRVAGAWAELPVTPLTTATQVLKPRLLNPQDELDGFGRNGLLRWNPIAGASEYEVWIYADAALRALVETSRAIRETQYQPHSLSPGRTYYVRVYSRVTDAWHAGDALQVSVVDAGTTARLVNPQEELDAFGPGGILRWSTVSDATAYEVWIYTDATLATVAESSGPLTGRSYATRTLAPGRTYFAWVLANVGGQWTSGSPMRISTVSRADEPRLTNAQEELDAFATDGTLRWSEVPGASAYELWIYTSVGLLQVAESANTGPRREYRIARLCGDGTYYVKLFAYANGSWSSGWATPLIMSRGASPADCSQPAPVITLRADPVEADYGGTARLTWTSRYANSCSANGAWSGARLPGGQEAQGPLLVSHYWYGLACSGPGGTSTAEALVTVRNGLPTAAVAGPARADVGDYLTLTSEGSSDPEQPSDELQYHWTLRAPAGSLASLSNSQGHLTGFAPDVAGSYRVELVVIDGGQQASAPAVHTIVVTPPPPIAATLLTPKDGDAVPDAVPVFVHVQSTYEVRTVTASLDGSSVPLSFDPQSGRFVGTLSLAGRPTGARYGLGVRAVDTRGNADELSVEVVHDNPPEITVAQPIDLSVALPTVPVDARCTDDQPGCIVELIVGGERQQSAVGWLSGSVDLGAWTGRSVRVVVRARDGTGQIVEQQRLIYVEDGLRLAIVAEVPGEVVDADATRLLFVQRSGQGDALAIYDRVTGSTEPVAMPAGLEIDRGGWKVDAYLTSGGAIFMANERGGLPVDWSGPNTSRVYLWHDRVLSQLGRPQVQDTLAVNGSYAIWHERQQSGVAPHGRLHRIDTSTGTASDVRIEGVSYPAGVAPDGSVAFRDVRGVVLDRSGQQSVVLPKAGHEPLTDGASVVVRSVFAPTPPEKYAILLVKEGTPMSLTGNRASVTSEPGREYQLANGWTAYTDLGSLGQLHVFTRSPDGTVTRHSDLAASSLIDRLGDNGEVMMISEPRRYFSRGAGMVPVSSSAGESFLVGGRWYVAIGRALLAVNTD